MAYIDKNEVKIIRDTLKEKFSNIKFSVTKGSSSSSVDVCIMESEYSFDEILIYEDEYNNNELVEREYCSVNHYHLDSIKNPEYKKLFKDIVEIMKGENFFDHSNSMEDYFHTKHYLSINLGKWNSPYKQVGKKIKDLEEEVLSNPDINLYLFKTSKTLAVTYYDKLNKKNTKVLKKFKLEDMGKAKEYFVEVAEEYEKKKIEEIAEYFIDNFKTSNSGMLKNFIYDSVHNIDVNINANPKDYSIELAEITDIDLSTFPKSIQTRGANYIKRELANTINKNNKRLLEKLELYRFEFFKMFLEVSVLDLADVLKLKGTVDREKIYKKELENVAREVFDNNIIGDENIKQFLETNYSPNQGEEVAPYLQDLIKIKSSLNQWWDKVPEEEKHIDDTFKCEMQDNKLFIYYFNILTGTENRCYLGSSMTRSKIIAEKQEYIQGFEDIDFIHEKYGVMINTADLPIVSEVIGMFLNSLQNIHNKGMKILKEYENAKPSELTDRMKEIYAGFTSKNLSDKERLGNNIGIKGTNIILDDDGIRDVIEGYGGNKYSYDDIYFPNQDMENKFKVFLVAKYGSMSKHLTTIEKEVLADFISNSDYFYENALTGFEDEVHELIIDIQEDKQYTKSIRKELIANLDSTVAVKQMKKNLEYVLSNIEDELEDNQEIDFMQGGLKPSEDDEIIDDIFWNYTIDYKEAIKQHIIDNYAY